MSKYLSVQCDCGKQRIVFGDSKSPVNCECSKLIVEPTGGKAKINCRILEVLG
ncbi:MAG: 30S ribosomal protein S27e [Candidatus Micrarchaeota archaeon]